MASLTEGTTGGATLRPQTPNINSVIDRDHLQSMVAATIASKLRVPDFP
jgi:hypothetical protein